MPRISRIFQNIELISKETVALDKQKSHYITNVLRLKSGDALTVFNGRGGEFSANIKTIDKHHVILNVGEQIEKNLESPLQIHLGQGISRGERMDFVLQKAVELGVNKITPLITQRCNVKIPKERWAKRLTHWRGVIESACEQSGRNLLPEITEPTELYFWLNQDKAELKLVLSHRATQKLSELGNKPTSVSLLIGPEGGLSEDEVELATQCNFQTIRMGARVMRTETAALAAISALQLKLGDF